MNKIVTQINPFTESEVENLGATNGEFQKELELHFLIQLGASIL